MKVAVIDAHGFVGSRVVETLVLTDDESVVAISRQRSQHTLAARFDVDLRVGNPLDADSLTESLHGCSIAIHTATGNAAELKPMAAALAIAAARAKVRKVVYLSSAVVHGPDPPAATTESTRPPSKLLDEFAAAQQAAERHLLAACEESGVTAHALRPGVVYGPRSPLIDAIAEELRDGRAWVLDEGGAIFNGIYTDNLIDAIRLCLKSRATAGRAFLVADAETVTWNDVHRLIARELEMSASRMSHVDLAGLARTGPRVAGASRMPADFLARAPLQQARAKIGFAAAAQALGYAPHVSFEEGLIRTCGWWRFARGQFTTP